MGQRKGQSVQDPGAHTPLACAAAARLAPHVRPHQRERKLASQQFIVGEPGPGQLVRRNIVRLSGPVEVTQRDGKRRELFARNPTFILPFRQVGQSRQRTFYCAPHIAESQPFGQRVDRFDQGQRGKPGFVDHPIGMHHLQHAVVKFGGAGDIAQSRRRAGAFPNSRDVR